MASMALSVVGCIDYLAYGTIFTRATFRPKKKLDVFSPARKAVDERCTSPQRTSWAFLRESKNSSFRSLRREWKHRMRKNSSNS